MIDLASFKANANDFLINCPGQADTSSISCLLALRNRAIACSISSWIGRALTSRCYPVSCRFIDVEHRTIIFK